MDQRRFLPLWNRTLVNLSCWNAKVLLYISGTTAQRNNIQDRLRLQNAYAFRAFSSNSSTVVSSKPFLAATTVVGSTTTACLNTDLLSHPDCNITLDIAQRVGKNLHLQPKHPINIIKERIESYWKSRIRGIEMFDNLHPLVSTQSNFDSLLIDEGHVSRSRSDTYYYNHNTVLRTHTSAHQTELLSKGLTSFLVTGDVYRRDEIDSSHYPIFHQMEGVKLLTELCDDNCMTFEERVQVVEHDLKEGLEGLARELFGDVVRNF
jgi:phenylalanyl-tRNA synthetase alpha subunit